jgi:hypothetical protein
MPPDLRKTEALLEFKGDVYLSPFSIFNIIIYS